MSSGWRRQIGMLGYSIALSTMWQGVGQAANVGNKYTDPMTNEVLEYNVFVPTGYDPAKKYPLMVFLHAANNTNPPNRTLSSDGVGWTGSFINTPHQTSDPSFFMIPISQTNMGGWGGATDPITTPEKFEGRLTIKVLQEVVMTKYSIDPSRLYITGPSMGGRGTWDIIRRYPKMFAASAPAAAPAGAADAALYVNQNIWAICGQNDPIVAGQREAVQATRMAGGNIIYTELAGHGHDSWRWVYPDPQFVPWMYAQRLGVPWWTVSKAPTGPFTGSSPAANLTADQPVTVTPPGGLPTSFGGASGTGSAGSSGTVGTPGAGGISGTGGISGGAGRTGGAAGAGGSSGPAGSSGTGTIGATGGSAESTGGAPALPSTGGATVASGSSGGAPVTAGASSGAPTSSGGAGPVTPGSTGAPQGSGGESGGCSTAPGSSSAGYSLFGLLSVLGLGLARRRRRGQPVHRS